MNALADILTLRRKAEEDSADIPALRAAAEKAVSSLLHGEHTQRKAGSGEKFWQYREYMPGDRPQDIDWRQSAKTDRVYIKQKEWQTTQTAIFWCSGAPGMQYSASELHLTKAGSAKILTLALGLLMTHAGEQVGMLSGSRQGRSDLALQHMAESLCHSQASETLPPTASLPKNSAFIATGDFLDPITEIETSFKRIAASADTGLIIQILDPAELELPFSGRVVFEGPSIEEHVRHVDSIRNAYQERIQDHLAQLEALCHQLEWTHILHQTDQEISNTLMKIWLKLEGA